MSKATIAGSEYSLRALEADERPRRFYEYFVTGRGAFPFDMLRYDHCWPADGDAAASIGVTFEDGDHFRKPRTIKLWSHREPTTARWSSFGWAVSGYRPPRSELAK